jgi:uncharacterized membrane protein YphA (DoxX/SURF4 family)
MAADKTAKFSIQLESNGKVVSAEAAAALENLQKQIKGSQDKVKGLSSSLRNLKGSSDEVKAAKERLKAAIGAEKDAISGAQVAMLRYGDITSKITPASGGFGAILGNVKEALGGVGIALGLVTAAAGVALGTITALTAGFVHWAFAAADAARSLGLIREAFAGSAENGARLGGQVDLLSSKVPIAKDKLNEMATQLMRTRLGGQAIVDTFNLTAQASSAMGDDVGRSLQDIVTRGQMFNRFRLNPLEMQGTGLMFKDVAKNLASQLHIGVAAAQRALFEGRVKLDDGAKALRTTVEQRFGEVNAKKMLSLGTQVEKFKEKISALASGINIEPLLKGFDTLSHLFDNTTVAGVALKGLVTQLGDDFVKTFVSWLPTAQKGIKVAILGALLLHNEYLKLRIAIQDAFGPNIIARMGLVDKAMHGIAFIVHGISVSVGRMTMGLEALEKLGILKRDASLKVEGGTKATTLQPKQGIGPGQEREVLGDTEKKVKGFASGGVVPKPASPDSVFVAARPGEVIMPPGQARGGGMGKVTITVPVTFNVHGAHAKEAADQIAAPSILAQLTKAVEDACKTAGIPTQTASLP